MKTVVIDLWAHSDCYDTSDSSMTLTVMSRIGNIHYPDLYWCCSFSMGYKNKPVTFGATNRSIGSRFKTTYKEGVEIHLYER